MSDTAAATTKLEQRYRVLFPIGKGGMGTVEVALERGVGAFRRIVAVKHMLAEVGRDSRSVDMFLREARLAQMLNHPNVVHAFGAGSLDGDLYISMEYVEGEPLSDVLSRVAARDVDQDGHLSPMIAAHVLAEVCDGLHAAHELRDETGALLGVVHRDLSPHNVMVSYEGHVKLLDFGVAKMDDMKKVTRTGEVKGKTAYMAPEQALGDALDRRSDLFAIGAVLFETLTGKRMWGHGSDMEVMRRLALESPPKLEIALPDAPPALVHLYNRLVEKKREERPDTARDVARELREYIASAAGEGPVDDRVVRALMQRLFAEEATKRRDALSEALERVVDSNRANELKKSLSLSGAPLTDSERKLLAAVQAAYPAGATSQTRPAADPLAVTKRAEALEDPASEVAVPFVRPRSLTRPLIALGLVAAGTVGVLAAAKPTEATTASTQMSVRDEPMATRDASASGASTASTTASAIPPIVPVVPAAPSASSTARPPVPVPVPRPSHRPVTRPEIDPHAI